jgi:hypothetical protein
MYTLRLTINVMTFIAVVFGLSVVTNAQATRSWVSGVGDDFNPCTRIAPCKTFAGALPKTFINGEINCLDAAGYGAVTINKSMTIDCEDTQGAILAAGVNGVTVSIANNNNDPFRKVTLRGLTINGQGTGVRGIWVTTANTSYTTLHVEHVVIENFTSDGIHFNAGGGELVVRNSIIQGTRNAVRPNGTNANLRIHATVEGSTLVHNERGIMAENHTRVTASNSNLSSNSMDGAFAQPTESFATCEISLYNCLITGNGQVGVISNGFFGATVIRLAGNHIVNNSVFGIRAVNGGILRSRGNNTISGNPTDIDGNVESMPGQ